MVTIVSTVVPGAQTSSQATPSTLSINPTTKLKIIKNKVNNQNSDLDARSEKLVYFTKHTFTASKKFMLVAPSYCTFTIPKKHGKSQTDRCEDAFHTNKYLFAKFSIGNIR